MMMETMKKSTKRKLAFLLSMVITLQSVLTGTGAGMMTARADETRTGTNDPIALATGNPSSAFGTLTATVQSKVENGNTVNVNFDADLDEDYLDEIRYEKIEEGAILDEISFEEGEPDPMTEGKPANSLYPTYDAYLSAQKDLPEISFTCTLSGVTFDTEQTMSGRITANKDDIGSYSVENGDGNLVLTAVFERYIYNRYNVNAGFSVGFEMNERYEEGATAGGSQGDGVVDVVVDIIGEQAPSVENSGYKISKTAEKEGNTGIVWTIHAEASPSEALQKEAREAVGNGIEDQETATPSDGAEETPQTDGTDGTMPTSHTGETASAGDTGTAKVSVSRNLAEALTATASPSISDKDGGELATGSVAALNAKMDEELDLTGMVISDAIPDGLEWTKVEVEVSINGGDYILLHKDKSEYTVNENGVLTYTIGDGVELSEIGKITSADIKIHTRLSDKLINNAAMANQTEVVYEFSNRAQLLQGVDGPVLAVSDRVNENITLKQFLDKIGRAVNSSQKSMEWTLTANPHFSGGAELYLVDHIEDITHVHKYDPSMRITIKKNGADETKLPMKILTPNLGQPYDGPSYNEITTVSNLMEELKISKDDFFKNGEPQVLVYDYDTKKTASNKEPIIDAIMLIPLSPKYLDGEVEIKYYTDTTVGLTDENPYGKRTNLENEVKAIWSWPDGIGIGKEQFGSITVSKNYPIDFHLVHKKGGGYDYAKNRLRWDFEVNQYRTAMDSLVITDEVDTSVQTWADLGEGIKLERALLEESNGESNGERTIPYLDKKPENGDDGYTLSKDGTKLTIYLGQLRADEVYTFSVYTRLSNDMLQKMTDGEASDIEMNIPNTIHTAAVINGKPYDQDVKDAQNTVKNPLIDKSVVAFDSGALYNFDDNTVKWGIEINENQWTLNKVGNDNAITITDVLPVGTTFGKMIQVKRVGEQETSLFVDNKNKVITDGNNQISWYIQEGTDEKGYSKDTVVFTFDHGSVANDYYFEFTTLVEENYRLNEFKSHGDAVLKNKATLHASLDGANFTISDTATNTIQPQPVYKKGLYFDEQRFIAALGKPVEVKGFHWQVVVNRTQVNMAGAEVKDEIQDCMELLPETLKVQKLADGTDGDFVAETGMLKADVEVKNLDDKNKTPDNYQFQCVVGDGKGAPGSSADETQFSYKIPEDDFMTKGGRLLISFDTVLVSDAMKTDMINAITVDNRGVKDHTDHVQGDGAKDFQVDDYANAKGMTYVKLSKTTTTKRDGSLPLKGAVFTVQEGTADAAPDNWAASENAKAKKKTTGKKGTAGVVFLKEGIWYQVIETTAPVGYELPADPTWYFKVNSEGNIDKVQGPDATYKIENGHTLEILDQPLTGDGAKNKITFTKKGFNINTGETSPLKDAKFTISHKTLTIPDDKKNFTTKDDGIVTFADLDVSTKLYTIRETITPEGYETCADITAYVKAVNGNVVTSLSGKDVEKVTVGGETSYVVTNKPIRASGSFQKVDQNGDPLAGVEFKVERKNDGFYETKNDGSYSTYTTPVLTSDRNGKVEFKNFPMGTYKLTENTQNLSLVDNAKVYIYLTIHGDGKVSISREENQTGEPLTAGYQVVNELQYGHVEINKLIGERNSNGVVGLPSNGKVVPKGDIYFDVYRAESEASDKPVMRLKITDEGHFERETTGDKKWAYHDYLQDGKLKYLLCGSYYLKEVQLSEYEDRSAAYYFDAEWDADQQKPKTVYVGSEEHTQESDPWTNSNSTAETLFYNIPLRKTISLQKQDADHDGTRIHGAEFEIKKNNNILAKLLEDGDTGNYVLKPMDGQLDNKTDENGRIYLIEEGNAYKLLLGDYILTESTVPKDYQKPSDIILHVRKDGVSVEGTDTKDFKILTNTVGKQDIRIKKYVETRKVNGSTTEYDTYTPATEKTKFKFELTGTPVNSTKEAFGIKEATTDNDGIATFSSIPLGEYEIKEVSDAKSSYMSLDKTIYVTVKEVESKNNKNNKSIKTTYSLSLNGPAIPDTVGVNENTLVATTNNETAEATLHVANACKLGSATGTKVTLYSDKTRTPLAGAVFSLYRYENDEFPKNAYMTCVTDASGNMQFDNLPYGKYALRETSLTGYDPYSSPDAGVKDFEISNDHPTVKMMTENDPLEQIVNKPVSASGSFKKVDQNGNHVTGIKFSVERKNDGLFGYTEANGSYSPYTDPTGKEVILTSDDDGVVNFENFLYGKYRLKEDLTDPANEAVAAAEPVYISIGLKNRNHLVEIKQGEGDYTELTTDSEVENTLKYGYVDINKTIGEKKDTEGTLGLPSDGTETRITGTTNLEVRFEIYEASDTKFESPVMRLALDDNGNLKKNKDGSYANEIAGGIKYLLRGNYVLKEVIGPEGYEQNKETYLFTIKWVDGDSGKAGNPDTVYIDSNSTANPTGGAKGQYLSENPQASAINFYNAPARNAVTLTKVDGTTKVPVTGAEFTVYADTGKADTKVEVALLKEDGKPGTYVLQPVRSAEEDKRDSQGRLYLEKDAKASEGDKDVYKLLYGSYTVKETTIPDDYENPYETETGETRETITITVGDTVTMQVGDAEPTTELILTNTMKTTSIPLQKYVETRKPGTAASEHDGFITGEEANGFEFTLTGMPSNTAKDSDGNKTGLTMSLETGTEGFLDGEVVFENIPMGTYTIRETGIPARYQMAADGATAETAVETLNRMKPVTVKVEGQPGSGELKVTFLDENGKDLTEGGENGFTYGDDAKLLTTTDNGQKGAKLYIADTLKLGDITGTKVVFNLDKDGKTVRTPLNGVGFELWKKDGTSAYTVATTSNADKKEHGKAQDNETSGSQTPGNETGNDGTLIFKDLPYGEYILKELTPPGYTATQREIPVTVDGSHIDVWTEGDEERQITNELIRKTLVFSKTDQNGDLIREDRLGVEFKVKPVDGQALADGIYKENSTVFKNDDSGTVTITDLAYGTYEVTETEKTAGLLAEEMKPFYIIIERAGEMQTKITLSDTQNPADGESHAKSLTKEDADNGVYDFTAGAAKFTVENQLKYADLTFTKVAADQDENGNLVMGQNAKPLEGVGFEVYFDANADGTYDAPDGNTGDPKVLTLVTGRDGKPKQDNQGRYLDETGKAQEYRLVYGNHYLVKETGFITGSPLAERYWVDNTYYALDVTEEYAGKPVYFGSGKTLVRMIEHTTAPGEIGFMAGDNGTDWRFPNSQLYRGTVVLKKTDSANDAPVKGANLELYAVPENGSAGVKVAPFAEANGIYKPVPGEEANGFTPLNEAAQSYLVKGSDGQYHLLVGNYYVQEAKAPSGYETPAGEDGRWYFTVTETKPDVTENDLTDRDGQAKALKNTLTRQEVSITKLVEEFTKGTYRDLKEGDVFTFTLSGTQSNGDTYTKTVDADPASGKAVFADVPGGSYTLTEVLTEAQKEIYRTPADLGVLVEEEKVTYTKDEADTENVIRNDLKRGAIEGKKLTHDKDGKELPLAGAGFKLTRLAEDGTATGDVRNTVSGDNGAVHFEDLPLGLYRLEETDVPADYEETESVWLITVEIEDATVTEGIEIDTIADGQTPEDGMLKKLHLYNEAVGSISLSKRAEVLKANSLIGEMKPGQGFRFKITGETWDKKVIGTLGNRITVIGEDVLVNEDGIFATTGADGTIRADGLPAGNYTVTEVENAKNDGQGAYVLDTAGKNADINVKNQKVEMPEVSCSNRLKRSVIQGLKTMSGGQTPLKDAVIGIFADGTKEFTEENLLFEGLTATSDENGLFRFENIPAGTYRIAELTAPAGYRINTDTYYTVTVLTDGSIITQGSNEKGEQAELVITNIRNSSGGGGGTPTKPAGSSDPTQGGPGVSTEETTENPSESTGPDESLTITPGETIGALPEQPDTPIIPAEKEPGKPPVITVPDVEEGTKVAITERDDNEVIYKGRTDSQGRIYPDIPAGDYTLVVLDDNEVPLAAMFVTITDQEVPLAAPDAGDHSVPVALLAAMFLGATGGAWVLLKKRKKLMEQDEA